MPLHGLLLAFWGDMGYPCFITGNDVCEKLIAVLLIAPQKGKCRSHMFRFVFWVRFFGTHLAQSFQKCRFSVTIWCTVFHDTFGKNSARSVMVKCLFLWIFTSICCTRSGVTTLGRPLHLSSCTLSRPLSNCLHHHRTILPLIAPSP